LDVDQYLVKAGARIDDADDGGNTAVVVSARYGQFAILQWMLEHTSATILETSGDGATIWDLLTLHMVEVRYAEHDPTALIALLRVLVLHSAPPPRAGGPTFSRTRARDTGGDTAAGAAPVVQRWALLDAHCPVLLHGYMELTTTKELWATGLGQAP
jgi:hypothetical protein